MADPDGVSVMCVSVVCTCLFVAVVSRG
jgi:hypothetical protein